MRELSTGYCRDIVLHCGAMQAQPFACCARFLKKINAEICRKPFLTHLHHQQQHRHRCPQCPDAQELTGRLPQGTASRHTPQPRCPVAAAKQNERLRTATHTCRQASRHNGCRYFYLFIYFIYLFIYFFIYFIYLFIYLFQTCTAVPASCC